MTPQSLIEQVEARISQVREAQASALAKLEGRMWHTEATRAAINAVRSLTTPIEGWAARGLDNVAKDTTPSNGWAGWIAAGNIFVQGLNEQVGASEYATLANLHQTAIEAGRDVIKVAKAAERTASRAMRAAGETVGAVAGSATKPLLPVLGLAVAGLVAVAFIMWGRR